jgi:hypothetical protein
MAISLLKSGLAIGDIQPGYIKLLSSGNESGSDRY